MSTPKGGRGKQAPYQTVQVRCPVPVKPLVTELIHQFHECGSIENLNTGIVSPEIQDEINNLKKERDELMSIQIELEQLRSQLSQLVNLVDSKTKGYTANSASQLITALRQLN